MAQDVAKSDYEAAVNDKFQVDGEDVALTLEAVTEGDAVGDEFECFSLEFRGPKEGALEQGNIELSHEKLGDLELFMTPVEEDDDGRLYQAVFNREKKGD